MWIVRNYLSKMDDESFRIIGKALFVAQKFEMTCKDTLEWFLVVQNVVIAGVPFLGEEHLAYSEKLEKLFLGQIVNTANNQLRNPSTGTKFLTEDNHQILDKGIKGRNWIAHEGCGDIIQSHFANKPAEIDTGILTQHLEGILTADWLMSKWSYEFHEREPAPYIDKQGYISGVCRWVLSGENAYQYTTDAPH